jgi:uncharacterized Zn finger protein (UPF0148 family)
MAPSIVALSCPNCGANLDVKPGAGQITCPFCCKAVMVNWGDDTLSREPTGQSPDQARVVLRVGQAQGAAQPAQKPEVVQEDLRARERLADHALLQRMEQERIAAEAVAVEESLRLSRLRDSIGQNRFFSFAAIGCALLIAACFGFPALSALSLALRGDASAGAAIGPIFFELCLAGIALGVGFFLLWALSSASRRLSGQIQEHERQGQAIRSQVDRLRQQEAHVRSRLVE